FNSFVAPVGLSAFTCTKAIESIERKELHEKGDRTHIHDIFRGTCLFQTKEQLEAIRQMLSDSLTGKPIEGTEGFRIIDIVDTVGIPQSKLTDGTLPRIKVQVSFMHGGKKLTGEMIFMENGFFKDGYLPSHSAYEEFRGLKAAFAGTNVPEIRDLARLNGNHYIAESDLKNLMEMDWADATRTALHLEAAETHMNSAFAIQREYGRLNGTDGILFAKLTSPSGTTQYVTPSPETGKYELLSTSQIQSQIALSGATEMTAENFIKASEAIARSRETLPAAAVANGLMHYRNQ
ncbi:MAG TPA: hypothetical protein PLK94_06260, partial [Alphaproteobacteria bacterium]|nr:hypothetical protein [Alphaproteobacteria bacterium]